MAPILLPPLNFQVLATQYTERTEGLHLSQITGDILVGLDPKKYGRDRRDSARWMNFVMGLLWEEILMEAWVGRTIRQQLRPELIRPGEVECEGVIGTPDAYDIRLFRPEEYKCTKMSCRQDIMDKKFWHYWVQLKAYAYMLGCNSGALYVLFINGNYNRDEGSMYDDPESGYVMKGWYDEWSDLQLQENWQMITNHARRRGWLK